MFLNILESISTNYPIKQLIGHEISLSPPLAICFGCVFFLSLGWQKTVLLV